jgi:hypothetical protein
MSFQGVKTESRLPRIGSDVIGIEQYTDEELIERAGLPRVGFVSIAG